MRSEPLTLPRTIVCIGLELYYFFLRQMEKILFRLPHFYLSDTYRVSIKLNAPVATAPHAASTGHVSMCRGDNKPETPSSPGSVALERAHLPTNPNDGAFLPHSVQVRSTLPVGALFLGQTFE